MKATLFMHGSPERWAASSNPLEKDDPWQGAEGGFFMAHGGEKIKGWLYQLRHGDEIYHDANEDEDVPGNYLNRWQDGVMRMGAGFHNWRIMIVVAFETVAFEFFRHGATPRQAREVATRLKRVADKWGVKVGYGNGLPLVDQDQKAA